MLVKYFHINTILPMDTPGKRIQKWREHLNKTPKEFADLTDIPYSTLKTLETDPKKGKPSFDVLAKLRKAFPQLNIDWLFDEGDTEPMLREDRNLVSTGKQIHLDVAQPELTAQSNNDEFKHKYDALLELVTKGFFGSPEQLLRGLSGKTRASVDAADLYETVDAIMLETPVPYEVPGFKWGVQRQLA
jgi:transcriptional regulator with XRE-family HTH domain